MFTHNFVNILVYLNIVEHTKHLESTLQVY